MRKNYFQNVKIADKLKMVMKAIFAILLVNNILFAILMLVFGHPVWIIIPVIAVVGMPLLSKMIIQELTENILEPLDQIEKAADDMAHGNLEIDISYQGKMNWESLQKVSAIHLLFKGCCGRYQSAPYRVCKRKL
ncbi:MAG: hypothetical protein ACLROW_01955 [Roseburia faecis]